MITLPAWTLTDPATGIVYLRRTVLWGVDSLENHDPAVPCSGYVHEIHTADGDRHPHNHPWTWAASVVLAGGYTEERADGTMHVHTAGDLVVLRPDDYHRIVSVLSGTVTLFLVGREAHDWGFLVDGVHVPHATYFERADARPMRLERA